MPALRGVLTSLILGLNTLIVALSLVVPSLVKLLVPLAPVRRVADRLLAGLASGWVAVNNAWIAAVAPRARWDVQGLDGLDPRGWYLVTSNHQTWVDILVLQRVFHGRIPFLKFFLKREEECLAACVGAPMMMVDHVYHEHLTPEKVDEILDGLE